MTGNPHSLLPLRDDPGLEEPELLLGARLLAHAQPLAKNEPRKRRVWNALNSGRPGRSQGRLTALHVAFASLLFAAVSSAAVGGYYVKQRASNPPTAPTPAANAARPSRAPASPLRTSPAAAPVAAPPVPAAPASAANAESRLPGVARVKADASAQRKASLPDADAALLVEAMRARSAGDSARVSELVEQYRARHPQGVLQEEALMLSIEAAVARSSPQASSLAREYLRRFPQGRFVAQARRALAEPR